MSTYYPPYKGSSNNIKLELDLTNYATKTDLKNITHTDVSSFASKTNLSALKTKVDKIDVDKLKTVPDDLAKLSNVVKNEVVKKTDFSADDYVRKTKFSGDINPLDDKMDKVEKKIPDVSSLETKRNVTTLVKNLDNRIDVLKIKEYAKKTTLSNYMLSLTSRLNDLKSQHIATEVKTDDKTKKNASDILGFESRLKQKEDTADEVQRENALMSGRAYYLDKMCLLYECKAFSFKYTNNKINLWKSNGINNYTSDSDMDAVSIGTTDLPSLVDNGRMSVKLAGADFKQTK